MGIIASIKEIVVFSVKAADEIGTGTTFPTRCGRSACSVCLILLGVTALLLRRKEREPGEGDSSPPAPERRVD